MAKRVIWSPSARKDLKSIVQYIGQHNKDAALALGRRIIDSSKQVENFSQSARIVLEYGDPKIRELIVGAEQSNGSNVEFQCWFWMVLWN